MKVSLPSFKCSPMTPALEIFCTERSDAGSPHIAAAMAHGWGHQNMDLLSVATSRNWYRKLSPIQQAELERMLLEDAIQFHDDVERGYYNLGPQLEVDVFQRLCLRYGVLCLSNDFLVAHSRVTLISLLREVSDMVVSVWRFQQRLDPLKFDDPVLRDLEKLGVWWWAGPPPSIR